MMIALEPSVSVPHSVAILQNLCRICFFRFCLICLLLWPWPTRPPLLTSHLALCPQGPSAGPLRDSAFGCVSSGKGYAPAHMLSISSETPSNRLDLHPCSTMPLSRVTVTKLKDRFVGVSPARTDAYRVPHRRQALLLALLVNPQRRRALLSRSLFSKGTDSVGLALPL